MHDPLLIAGRSFHSRLIVGTGKYKTVDETERAIDASGAEIITVAIRRVDLGDRSAGSLMSLLTRRARGLGEPTPAHVGGDASNGAYGGQPQEEEGKWII